MISNILFFSFLIVGASLICLIIDKLRKEICILFNIKSKKKTRSKTKKSTSKKNTMKRTVSKKVITPKQNTTNKKSTSLKKNNNAPIKRKNKPSTKPKTK